jgi:EPS-associated MarR family transcriptional regulator
VVADGVIRFAGWRVRHLDREMPHKQEDARFQVLSLLQKHPELSQRELAKMLGVSLGQTNFLLKALIDKGLIKVDNFRKSDNRMGYVYVLTPSGVAHRVALAANFLKRKMKEYEELKAGIEELRREVEGGTLLSRVGDGSGKYGA